MYKNVVEGTLEGPSTTKCAVFAIEGPMSGPSTTL